MKAPARSLEPPKNSNNKVSFAVVNNFVEDNERIFEKVGDSP